MENNDIKKDLYRSKEDAQFTHYAQGSLYYTVTISGEVYQFPIPLVEETLGTRTSGVGGSLELASDVSTLKVVEPGRLLLRWITKANDEGSLVGMTKEPEAREGGPWKA